jgi:hypothetical protein
LKIWRYVDLAKFVGMLATGKLHFTCISDFKDPYEGWLPRSYMKALTDLNRTYLDQMRQTRDAIADHYPSIDPDKLDTVVQDAQRHLNMQQLFRETNSKFGAICWHINEGESEAMWQLYGAAGSGIAIESTKDRLERALTGDGIHIDAVRYMNFEDDPIEKGHRYLMPFIKRKSFEHERELRAIVMLPESGKGALMPCDMDTLIAKIHIAPGAPPFYADAVRYVIDRADAKITAPVMPSRQLDAPDY